MPEYNTLYYLGLDALYLVDIFRQGLSLMKTTTVIITVTTVETPLQEDKLRLL